MKAWKASIETVRRRLGEQIASLLPARLQAWGNDVKDSLWLVPAVCTLLCAGLSFLFVKLDTGLELGSSLLRSPLLFGGGADGARGVLTAIAGSIVTVTGTIFSVVIVALQLASGQFTPRVMRHFTGDRINQIVLGIMIGTFTYCLLVLRTVRTADDDGGPFVPAVSVSVGIVLALVCISALIMFIHHSAKQLQVTFILQRATEDTRRLVRETFPADEDGVARSTGALPDGQPTPVRSRSSGYLHDIDLEHLKRLAADRDLTIHVLHPYGAHLLLGTEMARLWRHGGVIDDEDIEAVERNLLTGQERTLAHDVAYGFRQIADIAVKALSPGINDPTTATQAIDALNELLVEVGCRRPQQTIIEVDGRHAIYLEPVRFATLVDIAFTQIRHYGAADAVVMAHLIDGLRRVADLVPPRKRAILSTHGRLALAAALQAAELEEVRVSLQRSGAWTRSTPRQGAIIDPESLVSV